MENHPDPILIVEDSEVSRTMLVLLFEKAGYEVVAHSDGDEALADIAARSFSMLILDQQLPGKTGIELLQADRKYKRNTPAIFVTGNLQLEDAVKISHLGIAGIFPKPADPVALLNKASEITRSTDSDTAGRVDPDTTPSQTPKTEPEPVLLSPRPPADQVAYPTHFFPAASATFVRLTHSLWKIRNFKNTLLLTGSEGTLYEEIARDMHYASDGAKGAFRVYPKSQLNSDALLDLLAHSLIDEDLTTVLIRSVHELDSEGQELLRKVVGFEDVFMPFAQRVRFILTSDIDLNQALEDGSFSETLYFRIGSVTASIPVYSEMKEDVLPLARHFLESCPRTGEYKHSLLFNNEAVTWLKSHDWSENFADLKYLIATLVHFATRREITLELIVNVTQLIDAGSAPTRDELGVQSAYAAVTKNPPAQRPAAIPQPSPPPESTTNETPEPEPTERDTVAEEETEPQAPPRQGVASYLPEGLTSAEVEAAISSSTTTSKAIGLNGKRVLQRKKPGSYDFNKRLSDILSEDS